MSNAANAPPLLDWPGAALKLARELAALPARTVFAGRCVRAALRGRRPHDLELLTDASAARVLVLFPQAISLGATRACIATGDVRIDVLSAAAPLDLRQELLRRDLSVSAIAYDPLSKQLVDPFGGSQDVACRRIRPTAGAFADPLSALRACALVASEGLEPTEELESAIAGVTSQIAAVPRARLRGELERLLLGPDADAGLGLLRRTGLETALAPGTDARAARWVALLPADLPLRLSAWLHGARAVRILRRLRYPHSWVEHVEWLLRQHPVEGSAATAQARRRLARRGRRACADLVALRSAQLDADGGDPAARRLFDETRDALEALLRASRDGRQRPSLAIDGRAIMQQLGCGPGPRIGRALAHLERQVLADPQRNTEAELRALLDEWVRRERESSL